MCQSIRTCPSLANAYLKLRETYANQPDSLAKYTMLAYYKDYAYIKTYEDRYVKAIDTFNDMAKPEIIGGAFQVHLSEAEIIKRVCQLDGKNYMQPADSVYLQSAECNYVQKSTYKRLLKIADKFAKKVDGSTFYKADNSYANMFVVDYNGKQVEGMPQPKPALTAGQKGSSNNGNPQNNPQQPIRPMPQRRRPTISRIPRRDGR